MDAAVVSSINRDAEKFADAKLKAHHQEEWMMLFNTFLDKCKSELDDRKYRFVPEAKNENKDRT